MRYVLFEDAGGSPGVALFDAEGDPPPVAYVPLWSPLPRGLTVAGAAVVHGEPEEGEIVGPEDALALFDAGPPFEDDEGD